MCILKRARNGDNEFLKKLMKLLINEQQKSYDNEKICYICKENLENKCNMKNIVKLKIIVIIQRNIKVLRKAYVI